MGKDNRQRRAEVAKRHARLAYQKLGGKRLFGSESNFIRTLPEGVPLDALSELEKIFPADELDELIAPGQALSRRVGEHTPLNEMESERAVRVAFLTALAEKTFANDEKAHSWLRTPTPALGGKRPIDLSDKEEGAEAVEQLLYRIAHGIAA